MNFKKLLSLALVFTMVLTCASFFNGLTVSADEGNEEVIFLNYDGTFATSTSNASSGKASKD